jgi:hypothetical protein
MLEAASTAGTTQNIYQTTQHNIPEDQRDNLKAYLVGQLMVVTI